jgi:nitroreductase
MVGPSNTHLIVRRKINMDVIDAIYTRHSIRDFNSTPVAKETIMKILQAGLNSPSGGNAQPWEVFIASGAILEKIRYRNQERLRSEAGDTPKSLSLPPMPPHFQERFNTIRNDQLKLIGLNPGGPSSQKVFKEWGARLCGAPVLVVVCMDKSLSTNFDIGLFVQTILIAAKGYGIDSLVARMLITHQDILRQELEIPEQFNIIAGIGLGYANPGSIINTYRSSRRSLEEVVRFKS